MGPPPETLKEDNHTGGFHDTAGGLPDTWTGGSLGTLGCLLLYRMSVCTDWKAGTHGLKPASPGT